MKNSSRGYVLLVVAIVVLLIVTGIGIMVSKSKPADKTVVASQSEPVEFDLKELNASGQTAHVLINEVNGKAKITLTMAGVKSTEAQPAHVHIGDCTNPGEIAAELTGVKDGVSVTDYELSLDALMSHVLSFNPLSVVIHKSEADMKTYVACGDLPAGNEEEVAAAEEATKMEIVNVRYTPSGFVPKSVTIMKGQKVRFINEMGTPFSVASNPHPSHVNLAVFDQYKSSFKGATIYEYTFDKVGVWGFHNHLKPQDTGEIIVK
jgi:plastocyanin